MTGSRLGTILVIDDEEIMREILDTLLSREGYDVRLASSGAEGLELARATPFDAAVVDIMMPGLDGIATLDELKRVDEDLAVILITAYASLESESGTGKGLVARAIHANSSRSERSFITVNSGNLPTDLLESTLFGHVK